MPEKIRIATRDDVPQMITLRGELLKSIRKAPLTPEDLEAIRNFYENVWDGENPVYFVATKPSKNDELVGQAALALFNGVPSAKNPSGKGAYVFDVSVTREQQRRGLGKAIFTALLKYCRENSIGFITLDATEAGEPLYRSFGFAEPELRSMEIWWPTLESLELDE
jgi:GNAT superfamily N-acetyltransferase